MDSLILVEKCEDGSCCCIPHRSGMVFIATISLISSLIEIMTNEPGNDCAAWQYIQTFKMLLVTMFQMANFLLLLASVFENGILVQIYVWYTLGFVMMGFVVAIVEFLHKYMIDKTSYMEFVTQVFFLFVIFRCLPIVDTYRKHLLGE